MRSIRHVLAPAAFLLLASPPTANAFFEEFFGGGGGGGMQFQQQQQQVRQPKWPKGVPQEVSKQMSWLKGTEWAWNNDGWTVKLEKDGDLEAPVQQCRRDGCKWSAENGKFYILLGDAGVAEFDAEAQRPKNMKGMKMKGKLKADGQRITLSFQKVYDHSATNLDKDLYGALGLTEEAEEQEIKKAYRKMSIKYHPDKNPDEASKEKFAEIRDSYEILSDPDKKILYDTGGMEAVQAATKGEVQKTDDFEANFEVTLDELYLGTQKKVQIERRVVCRGCRRNPNAPQCKGCGKCPNEVKVVNVQMGPFMTQQQQEVPSKEKCKQQETDIEASIERGMSAGERLTFARMADQRPGMLPGALILKLKVPKHPKFERRGNDLHMGMTISLREALLGWTQTIRHIDGHTVEISSANGAVTKHLQVVVAKKEGMPQKEDPSSFGDLHVKINVDFPKKLDERQRALVEQIFEPTPKRNEL